MNTTELKKFSQSARCQLIEQVGAKLNLVLQDETAVLRGQEKALKQLQGEITNSSREAVIDRVAYIWFNRFCALRFMDVNRYSRIGAVSSVEGFSQPEILQDAKQGHIDDDLEVNKQKIFDLLGGQSTAADPQQEAYRLLLVAVCNSYHTLMPFMFERIADYTELLMPDDLLSENSVLQAVREILTEETCQDVEVIGWLYQFYISEKKDEVFIRLKKSKKITPENIPAATQLFTPHWIVKYLVENSLGRLWMLNYPDSRLIEKMEYYIKPDELKTDFLKINSPEEIKICDPACGSGHMLTYAFDLLYSIYEEEGYDNKEIPKLIFTNNLYGIEIDGRAGELAAFALFMKARKKYRRFFKKSVLPNICVLKNIEFPKGELESYIDEVGREFFTVDLQTLLHQFEETNNFGSLIRPPITDVSHARRAIEEKGLGSKLFFVNTHRKVLKALKQADFLSSKYHILIANPPYMGGRGMNARLSAWAKKNYPNSKADLFAMFIERNLALALENGVVAMLTMQSWMFLSSYEKLRNELLGNSTILSMAHLGPHAFDSIGGEVVSTTAFILTKSNCVEHKGNYLRLVDGSSEAEKKSAMLEGVKNLHCSWLYNASSADFMKIPGNPIAYWVSSGLLNVVEKTQSLSQLADPRAGLQTNKNELFLRNWYEVGLNDIGFNCATRDDARLSMKTWFPCSKGGTFRRWYGNNTFLINWRNDGEDIHKFNKITMTFNGAPVRSKQFYFREGMTWSSLSSSSLSMRYNAPGFIFETKGPMCFPKEKNQTHYLLALLNSKTIEIILRIFSPTLDFHEGPLGKVPVVFSGEIEKIEKNAKIAIEVFKNDWDTYEVSWDFQHNLLIASGCGNSLIQENKIADEELPPFNSTYKLSQSYVNWQKQSQQIITEMQCLEVENNRIFIEAYGLQEELLPEVSLNEITLICNPNYRYSTGKTKGESERLLLADTMKEFLSYAVGCMFGRYSLDKPGLILANQGGTVEDYLQQIPRPSFPADEDNVIPILDQDWFSDDLISRFLEFLKVTFGEDHYEENLKFITAAIGKDIRKYFLKDFYKDHLKTYKKRPIYWLFSSPKGSFNVLIYMHRYRPDTVSVILNDYLREFRTKLQNAQENLEQLSISADATKTEKTKALKQIEKLKKTITELDAYENETLYPLATQNVEIDLDDGVKVNYKKFGKALKKVPGLS